MIKTITRAAVLAVVAGSFSLAAVVPAQAQVEEPAVGRRCSFASVTDPDGENDDIQTGQVNAGPITATTPLATIQIICTIQVGAANSTHAGADACRVASPVMNQTATIPPTDDNEPPLCDYTSPEGVSVYQCTEIVVNGTHWYWDGANDVWALSSGVPCDQATTQEILPGPLCDVGLLLYGILGGTPPNPVDIGGIIHIGPDGDLYIAGIWLTDCDPEDNPLPPPPDGWFPDPLICQVLAIVFPPEGDIPDIWDCPPYNP